MQLGETRLQARDHKESPSTDLRPGAMCHVKATSRYTNVQIKVESGSVEDLMRAHESQTPEKHPFIDSSC